jgi:hypothetical protein
MRGLDCTDFPAMMEEAHDGEDAYGNKIGALRQPNNISALRKFWLNPCTMAPVFTPEIEATKTNKPLTERLQLDPDKIVFYLIKIPPMPPNCIADGKSAFFSPTKLP